MPYSKLIDPAPEVRSEARKQLTALSVRQISDDVKKLIVTPGSPEITEAALLFLHSKDASEIPKLLPSAPDIPSSRVRAALFTLVDRPLDQASGKLVAPFLQDANIIVRVRAANLLRQPTYLPRVVAAAVEALDSDETSAFGDPPVPAFLLGKRLLVDLKTKKEVLAELEKHMPKSERVKYHLLDVKAVLTGKSAGFVYSSIGNPTSDVKEKLDRL